MGYDIVYRIIDNQTDKSIFSNRNTNCFAEFMNRGASELFSFEGDRSIQVYRKLESIKLSEQNRDKYLKLLNKCGLKVSSKILFEEDIPQDILHRKLLGDTAIEFTICYKDYKSKQHINLALCLVRYIFECKAYIIIEKSLEYIDKNPECSILEAIRIISTYSNTFFETGHSLFFTFKSRPITKKIFSEVFFNEKYFNSELNKLNGLIAVSKETAVPELTVSYKEHLKFFNISLDEV